MGADVDGVDQFDVLSFHLINEMSGLDITQIAHCD